jgi:phosphate starvation-inducible PhoH-like protein
VSFEFRTDKQREAQQVYLDNDIILLVGPAGTGKTFLAMVFAIQDILQRHRSKIILTRPTVEAGESLGFLPGDFNEKVAPYMTPMYDCYHTLCPGMTLKNKILEQAFEVAPLAFCRGRTFNNSVCILDEAQNATRAQLKLFLTRFGTNSKIIITGDPQQTDIGVDSGLNNILTRLHGLAGVGVVRFTDMDIVRHPLIAAVLKRLEE